MPDTIAFVVGGSISHAEIRVVEPEAPPEPATPPPQPEPHIPFIDLMEPRPASFEGEDLDHITPVEDLDHITPVDLTRFST